MRAPAALLALVVAQGAGQIIVRQPQRPPTQGEFGDKEAKASGVPWPVLSAEKAWAGADVLAPLLGSSDADVRATAVKAVGRLEDPRLVPFLIGAQSGPIGSAIAQAMHGFDPVNDPQLMERVAEWMKRESLSGRVGWIRYASAGQVHTAEALLVAVATDSADDITKAGRYNAAMHGIEWLARLNQRVTAFEEPTLKVLTRSVAKSSANDDNPVIGPEPRKHAFTALVSAGAVDADSEKLGLNDDEWSIRRLAVALLAGNGGGLSDEARFAAIQHALNDPSPQVRYEALRAYVRRGVAVGGCLPIVEQLADGDSHVMLAAFDALGDACKTDEDITTRIAAEAIVPPTTGWHRPTHAFVALARRAPDKAAMSMSAFATHPSWWVRMYAARAAAAMKDVVHLDKLAYDVNDNVREATLLPLREQKKFDADPAIAAALNSGDVQLLRSAALLLKESPHTHYLFRPLMTALTRLTTEGKETSRDARLPLLDAIELHIDINEWPELRPLLRDFDSLVATRAAALITKLTGKTTVAEPMPVSRGWPAEFHHARDQCVTVQLAFGGRFTLDMDWPTAPMTVDRFLKLAVKDHYYDGLTFHRVVPNFVIQGGSPGANEYAGHKEYMRDEISASSLNTRGSVGLSIRGRNTGDAQFYVNLVDNPRLDFDYTIFAHVRDTDMPVIDRIEEGAEIRSIALGCAKPIK
jgi:cyclophilin family peptidyl-prolyl cis-trans isomerase